MNSAGSSLPGGSRGDGPPRRPFTKQQPGKQPFTKPRLLPDYILEKKRCAQFMEQYIDSDDYLEEPKYILQLKKIIERKSKNIVIEIDDVVKFAESITDPTEQEEWVKFARHIQKNAMRYIDMFSEMIDELMENITPSEEIPDYDLDDVIDVLRMYREARLNAQSGGSAMEIDGQEPAQNVSPLPKALTRRYELTIVPSEKIKALPLRKVRAQHIGGLIKVKGIVTRITEVKPLVLVVTYTCSSCSYEVYQEVNARAFTPLSTCPSAECKARNVPGRLYQQTRGSKFIKFQEMRLQELPEEVPMGHIPCSVTVHIRGELTRQCNPGDVTEVSGVYLPAKTSGYEALAGGLIANTFIQAMQLKKQKKSYAEYSITPQLERSIHELAASNNAYNYLSKSLAPEIYGHDDVKKALLLLMVGGVTLTLPDGMKIRGDINICLMGDPGVAKSQLLKHISHISPRGVYTSGKGSSGVGLTAAVVKDSTTNEWVLEGGALVLADMGVCCIDEFDKMEDSDRTAIHEVMEQQTISIAKAGITTTLNARTAILAAANPAYGRYNTRKTPEENINLPAALLSRFDLLFLILDKPDRNADMDLARHICYVHKHRKHPPTAFDMEYASEEFMRAYISLARNFNPVVPEELASFIVDAYVNMRAEEAEMRDKANSYTTARTLQAILRMSQALARIRLSSLVTREDVEEAMRLMYKSKSSLEDNEVRSVQDPMSAIYGIIRDCSAQTDSIVVKADDVLAKILAKGYTESQLEDCLREYEELNIWCYDPDNREIRFTTS